MVHDENMTWLWWCYAVYLQYKHYILAITNLCPLQGTGGHGLDPGLRLTKVVKNGTSCSSFGTQIDGVELGPVDPVSGQCDWVWYHVKCLGHDISVRQQYKSEHWAPCRNQTPSWYDWKNVESVVKPEQTTTKQLICNHAPAIYPGRRGGDSGGNVSCRFLTFIVPAAPRGCRVFVFSINSVD